MLSAHSQISYIGVSCASSMRRFFEAVKPLRPIGKLRTGRWHVIMQHCGRSSPSDRGRLSLSCLWDMSRNARHRAAGGFSCRSRACDAGPWAVFPEAVWRTGGRARLSLPDMAQGSTPAMGRRSLLIGLATLGRGRVSPWLDAGERP